MAVEETCISGASSTVSFALKSFGCGNSSKDLDSSARPKRGSKWGKGKIVVRLASDSERGAKQLQLEVAPA